MNQCQLQTMYKRNASDVLKTNDLSIDIRRFKLILKRLEIPHTLILPVSIHVEKKCQQFAY